MKTIEYSYALQSLLTRVASIPDGKPHNKLVRQLGIDARGVLKDLAEADSSTPKEKSWVCNECGSAEFIEGTVSLADFEDDKLACTGCSCTEFQFGRGSEMTKTRAILQLASNKVLVARNFTDEALGDALQGGGTDLASSIRLALAHLNSASAQIDVAIALAQGGR